MEKNKKKIYYQPLISSQAGKSRNERGKRDFCARTATITATTATRGDLRRRRRSRSATRKIRSSPAHGATHPWAVHSTPGLSDGHLRIALRSNLSRHRGGSNSYRHHFLHRGNSSIIILADCSREREEVTWAWKLPLLLSRPVFVVVTLSGVTPPKSIMLIDDSFASKVAAKNITFTFCRCSCDRGAKVTLNGVVKLCSWCCCLSRTKSLELTCNFLF